MSSQVVSFRFLQAVTNPVTDDQVTVGVLQWDGEHLRFVGDNRKVAGDRQESGRRGQFQLHRVSLSGELGKAAFEVGQIPCVASCRPNRCRPNSWVALPRE
jgi:hypothetical protein